MAGTDYPVDALQVALVEVFAGGFQRLDLFEAEFVGDRFVPVAPIDAMEGEADRFATFPPVCAGFDG
ncbi:hypothetical protein NK639_19055 [Pseudomonas sp. ZM24]|nr:hypothetical protein [Pseudomonas triclosanedens]